MKIAFCFEDVTTRPDNTISFCSSLSLSGTDQPPEVLRWALKKCVGNVSDSQCFWGYRVVRTPEEMDHEMKNLKELARNMAEHIKARPAMLTVP